MKKLLITITIFSLYTSCGEQAEDWKSEPLNITQEQAIVVLPEFHLTGVDHIPETLVLRKLGLTISELRFAPVNTEGIAYTTLEPIRLSFDLTKGELQRWTSPIRLPKAGRYLISVRIEPDKTQQQSFSMEGLVEEVVSSEDTSDSRPQPVLSDEKQEGIPEGWTSFKYESRRTVFYTLNDIEIVEGQQSLSFEFNAAKWSEAVVGSISKAIRNTEFRSEEGVDVTTTVESTGNDFMGLIETGVVENHRH